MKITLLTLNFFCLFFNLTAQNSSIQSTLFEREYKTTKGQIITLKIKSTLPTPLQIDAKASSLLLEIDAQNTIQLNSSHQKKIRNYLQASLLGQNCLIAEPTLVLTNEISFTLDSSGQDCFYLLQIDRQYAKIPFGEGLTLLRKLITLQG